MRSQRTQNKSQNKLFFCTLCSYVASSYEELDLHYSLSHNDDNDISYELETEFENIRSKRPMKKGLKGKAFQELKLLVEGRIFKDEYVGSCLKRYYIGRLNNTITLLPYATIC